MSIEKQLERKLTEAVRKAGGKAIKLTSPSLRGVTDRLVLLPGGRTFFVELKDAGKNLDPLQAVFKKDIEALGFTHILINSFESLNSFIQTHLC